MRPWRPRSVVRADGVLVGYGDAVPNGGVWRWTLNASGVSESWNGTLEEGLHGAADVFARNAVMYAAQPELTILVEVEGVPTLKEYARAAEMLGEAAAVRSVQLAEAAGSRATFSVVTRGGSDALLGNAGCQRARSSAWIRRPAARSHFACVNDALRCCATFPTSSAWCASR